MAAPVLLVVDGTQEPLPRSEQRPHTPRVKARPSQLQHRKMLQNAPIGSDFRWLRAQGAHY